MRSYHFRPFLVSLGPIYGQIISTKALNHLNQSPRKPTVIILHKFGIEIRINLEIPFSS
jgi:hypothetical protein